MEESERQQYEAEAQELRADLKRFEGDWASKNDGKKPGRNDIKLNPVIAEKYKKYNQVRGILDGKNQLPKGQSKPRKRKPVVAPSHTPSKRSRPAATPSKPQQHADVIDDFETPTIRRLYSPVVPTSVGPTPQRDGRVLGLFDLLDSKVENTPSKPRHGQPTLQPTTVFATPSKRTHDEMEKESDTRLGRTPISSSKRAMLDTFMTPRGKRDGNTKDCRSPSTVSKLQFSTPSFLRRAPLAPVDENGQYVSPAPIRLPRKPLVRGLSSVVASLRKLEEEKLDEDLEVLHEMENDAVKSGEPSRPAMVAGPKEMMMVPESQGPQLLGGFDDDGKFDSEPENRQTRDGQPLRVYKKKGQKRTTRKVNMRPTRAKRAQQPLEDPAGDSDSQGEETTVPETQLDATRQLDGEDPLDLGSESDFDGSDADSDKEKPKKRAKTKTVTTKDGPIKKAARKVNELAHANFKRLKLRNHGAKGGPGFGSKFRRRR